MALAELATQREMRENEDEESECHKTRIAVGWLSGWLLLVTGSLCLTVCTLTGVCVRFSSRGGRGWPELESSPAFVCSNPVRAEMWCCGRYCFGQCIFLLLAL